MGKGLILNSKQGKKIHGQPGAAAGRKRWHLGSDAATVRRVACAWPTLTLLQPGVVVMGGMMLPAGGRGLRGETGTSPEPVPGSAPALREDIPPPRTHRPAWREETTSPPETRKKKNQKKALRGRSAGGYRGSALRVRGGMFRRAPIRADFLAAPPCRRHRHLPEHPAARPRPGPPHPTKPQPRLGETPPGRPRSPGHRQAGAAAGGGGGAEPPVLLPGSGWGQTRVSQQWGMFAAT